MHLGHLDICLSVKDLAASLEFYGALGFSPADGSLDLGYVIVAKDQTRIGLYRHAEPDMLNFRGADIVALAAHLKSRDLPVPEPDHEADGSTGFSLTDPDGHLLYFNTLPGHDPAPEES
ncbi:VOC family protein [Luteolibacter sp. LG18]|uniref:VOC family protein n=1 Tax=Luteolibacter sp. LG18 TaxID=2819286 RepID=UPI002B2D5912|nr:hypothetical protein llg_40490 [Luteolibacter sp. LG18]